MTQCLACAQSFEPRINGGRKQKFCSGKCRREWHGRAARIGASVLSGDPTRKNEPDVARTNARVACEPTNWRDLVEQFYEIVADTGASLTSMGRELGYGETTAYMWKWRPGYSAPGLPRFCDFLGALGYGLKIYRLEPKPDLPKAVSIIRRDLPEGESGGEVTIDAGVH